MKDKDIILKLFSQLKGKRLGYFIGLLGTSSFMLIFNFIAAYGLKWTTEAAMKNNILNLNKSIMFMFVGIVVVIIVIPFLAYLHESVYKISMGNMKKKLYSHIQSMPADFYETHESGEIISKFNNDVNEVKNFYGSTLCDLLSAFISGIGSMVLLYILNWKLASAAICIGLANITFNKLVSGKIKELNKEIQEGNAESIQGFINIIEGFSTTKLYNLEDELGKKFNTSNKSIYKRSMSLAWRQAFIGGVNSILDALSFIGVLAVGCFMAYRGEISIGTILAVVQLQNGLNMMFNTIGNYVIIVQKSFASAERVLGLFNEQNEYGNEISNSNSKIKTELLYRNGETNQLDLEEKSAENIKDKCEPYISLQSVDFSYNTREFKLKDINIDVNKGETIAIVGLSGSGKSSILKLLLRFYDIHKGNIFINGRDVNLLSKAEIRSEIAYVQQDSYIFNGTVAENISLGKENASDDEIKNAAKLAYADEFINGLPNGYDEILGGGGVSLSGGERQRITIARAFLKNAPILVLDEATSALDSDSEIKIQQALKTLMKGRTTIVIAHRLSTIINADRIYVMKNGEIVESGKNDDLLAMGGMYSKLHEIQFN